ncbi:DoxX family protein [Streptomyces sp. bgisy082]|uniref:DoxX family protein n=1 Tax=Streptomyces sp. bgisy082 TaxID=3413776 RepID=UPI003D73680A
MPRPAHSALALAGLMAAAGTAHFLVPRPFDSIVPRVLPGSPRTWTRVSGVAELALAAGLAVPSTRRASARATALFFAAVLPANVKMAYDWRHRPASAKAVAYGRVPLQLPLVLWARHAARAED